MVYAPQVTVERQHRGTGLHALLRLCKITRDIQQRQNLSKARCTLTRHMQLLAAGQFF
jgi:hypothetical protein